MFLIDISPSMGKLREVQLPDGPDGEKRTAEMTNLQWALQFVLLKIQEMVCMDRISLQVCIYISTLRSITVVKQTSVVSFSLVLKVLQLLPPTSLVS